MCIGRALLGLIAVVAIVASTAVSLAADTNRPNILLILADDLGAKELACYGHPKHRTPRLDELARTGVRFETCYATPLCHPTRFELLTGQYGCHNGVLNFAGKRGGPEPNSPVEDIGANHITFAEILKARGYATAMAGKWQLSGEIPTLIHDCGFDEYLMWAYRHNWPKGTNYTGGYEGKGKEKPSRYWHPSLVRNGQYVPTQPDDFGADLFTDSLIDFMKRNQDKPFCAYYSMCQTHAPWVSTPDSTRSESDRSVSSKANFQANVEYVDKLVGRLIDTLSELKLRERTIVIFTADNGTGGEGKGDATELGARVPMIVNCPGRVKSLGACEELVDLSDVMPTLAELTGAQVPNDRPIDGQSFVSILEGKAGPRRDWIFSYLGDRRVLRDKRWLLEDNSPLQQGRLYDCGTHRDGQGYRDVTDSQEPEVLAARERFEKLLANLPAPLIEEAGSAKAKKPERAQAKAARAKRKSAKE